MAELVIMKCRACDGNVSYDKDRGTIPSVVTGVSRTIEEKTAGEQIIIYLTCDNVTEPHTNKYIIQKV